jgi:hypothetical protein
MAKFGWSTPEGVQGMERGHSHSFSLSQVVCVVRKGGAHQGRSPAKKNKNSELGVM